MNWGFNATNHSKEHGGQGMTLFEQMLVSEQLGMSTGAIWDAVPQPSFPMKFGTQEQIDEYLIPSCQCKRRDAYAITEADAGSDPTQCQTTAVKCDGGYKINGEKWYVTVGNVADFLLVHTHLDGYRLLRGEGRPRRKDQAYSRVHPPLRFQASRVHLRGCRCG